jgi:hypothetical protein
LPLPADQDGGKKRRFGVVWRRQGLHRSALQFRYLIGPHATATKDFYPDAGRRLLSDKTVRSCVRDAEHDSHPAEYI